MPSETYEFLKNIVEDNEVDLWRYPDDLINRVYPSSKNPSSTQIEIRFDDNDFLEVLGITDDDDIYVWNIFMDSYYGGREYDWQYYNEEWSEGYIIDNINNENKELIKEIMSYLTPGVRYNLNEHEGASKVSKYLEKRYERYVDNIIDIYATEHEECKERAVKKELEDETKNPFSRFGIVENTHSWKYTTNAGILLSLYRMVKDYELDLKELLTNLIEKYDTTYRGDWYELEYNVYCNDYDSNYVNNQIKEQLENLLEEIEEEIEEGGGNIEEFNKIFGRIEQLGGLDNYIDIPDKNLRVKFGEINPKTNSVRYFVKKIKPDSIQHNRWKERSLSSVEELNTLLYNYELFETIRKIVRKIL